MKPRPGEAPLGAPPASDDALVPGAVRARGLSRHYSTAAGPVVVALAEVDLDLDSGTALALVGASGSGKSTLLHILGGMDSPDEGSVVVGGVDLTRLNRRQLVNYRRTVGFVFQRFLLLPALSAVDNVLAPLLPYATSFNKRERALELLEAVGLGDRADALPSRLSGGQQQRVAIARALANGPALLLADEPTGNLDSRTGDEIMDLLLRQRDDHGTTLVIATHDERVAARCDRILTLRDGRLVSDIPAPRRTDWVRPPASG